MSGLLPARDLRQRASKVLLDPDQRVVAPALASNLAAILAALPGEEHDDHGTRLALSILDMHHEQTFTGTQAPPAK